MSKLSHSTNVQTIYQHFRFRCGRKWGVPVEWIAGTTVLKALVEATVNPHGVLSFDVQYSQRGAFVTEVDEEANVAGDWYWMYRVNGEIATVGCDQRMLQPFDIVQWEQVRFDPRLANPENTKP